jgi:hypothetical protein
MMVNCEWNGCSSSNEKIEGEKKKRGKKYMWLQKIRREKKKKSVKRIETQEDIN